MTPGPWRWADNDDGNFRVYGPDGMGEHSGPVAEVMHRHSAGDRRDNARAIAYLPDLLDALREIATAGHDVDEFDMRGIAARALQGAME